MNKVSPLKIEKVANELRQDKPYRRAMINTGYSEGQANRGKANKVIQEAIKQNIAEFKKIEVTVESVKEELDRIKELALKKRDYATAKECAVWKGKTIAAFTDKQQIDQNITNEVRQDILKRFNINRIDIQ